MSNDNISIKHHQLESLKKAPLAAVVEVCTGPGRQIRDDFSNGPGQAGK